jgi:regulator of extracellular matrix RemA (YlzA/DUF370 family)
MMISIGFNHYIESRFIVEILEPEGLRAAKIRRKAVESGRLINATNGRMAKSIIRLKSNHIVLSALEPRTIKSRTALTIFRPSPATHCKAALIAEDEGPKRSNTADETDRRIEPERRRFTYTACIPERRSGSERRDPQKPKK